MMTATVVLEFFRSFFCRGHRGQGWEGSQGLRFTFFIYILFIFIFILMFTFVLSFILITHTVGNYLYYFTFFYSELLEVGLLYVSVRVPYIYIWMYYIPSTNKPDVFLLSHILHVCSLCVLRKTTQSR